MLERRSGISLLVGEGEEDVLLCAHPAGHVLLLVVKLVVASLGAADHLGQRVVLMIETSLSDYEEDSENV